MIQLKRLYSILAVPALLSVATPVKAEIKPVDTTMAERTAAALPQFFTQLGKLSQFQWAPDTYTTGFKYDVLYYIPKGLPKNAKALVFMHGGGASTMTREGALEVAKLYAEDFIPLAEKQKFVLVVPSSAGLNWGGHTRIIIRALTQLMKKEISIDPNSIGLSGHSMGGMGITRNHMWLSDLFAFIMPIAAGMDPKHMGDENLKPIFNTPYYHMQGLNDHFTVFVERAKLHALKMKNLELSLGKKSKFKLDLNESDHNYNIDHVSDVLEILFKTKRDRFQNDLYGSFLYANEIITDNNIQYNYTSNDSYFWLKALEFTPTEKPTRSEFEAHVKNNVIKINFKGDHNIKKLRVMISTSMVSVALPIVITVNGNTKFIQYPPIALLTEKVREYLGLSKPGQKAFEYYVDIKL